MGWVLFVTAGMLLLAGTRLLLAEARRSQVAHRHAIGRQLGLAPLTEARFGVHGFGAHVPGDRLVHVGRIAGVGVAVLWDVDMPVSLSGRARMGVVAHVGEALPESAIERHVGRSKLTVTGDASWLPESLWPVLEANDDWFRIETAGDQLLVLENVEGKRSSVAQVARILVMVLGVLQRRTEEVESLANGEARAPEASVRLLAGYSLVAMGGVAVLAGIGLS